MNASNLSKKKLQRLCPMSKCWIFDKRLSVKFAVAVVIYFAPGIPFSRNHPLACCRENYFKFYTSTVIL